MNIIGQAIDPTRIDQELVDGKQYWQMVPDVEYSIEGNKRRGSLLVAPALGFERSIVRTPEGKDFEMSPAYYSAEILLDGSYRMLTLRFYRIEVAQDQSNNVRRRLVDAVPSPIIEDFLPRVKRLMEGRIRVVKPGPAGFDMLAEQSKKKKAPAKKKAAAKKTAKKAPAKKAPAKKTTKKAPAKKKAAPKKKSAAVKTTAKTKKATTRKATVKKTKKSSSKKPVKGKKR